jgi:hypothetical protein
MRPGELTQFAGFFFCLLRATLIGCSEVKLGSEQQKQNPNVYPGEYEADIVALIEMTRPDDMLDVQLYLF